MVVQVTVAVPDHQAVVVELVTTPVALSHCIERERVGYPWVNQPRALVMFLTASRLLQFL